MLKENTCAELLDAVLGAIWMWWIFLLLREKWDSQTHTIFLSIFFRTLPNKVGSIKFPGLKNLSSQIQMNNGMATIWPGTWNIANKVHRIWTEDSWVGHCGAYTTWVSSYHGINVITYTYSMEQEMAGICNISTVVGAVPKTVYGTTVFWR